MIANTEKAPETTSAPGINARALAHMEEKYGETFAYLQPWGNSMSGVHKLLVTCESFPEQPIVVQVEGGDDAPVYSDNYLAVKYRDKTVEYFQKCADGVFDRAIVHYNVTKAALSPGLPADAPLERVLADGAARLTVFVEVDADAYTGAEQASQLSDIISELVPNYYLPVIVVESDRFGTYDSDALEALKTPVHCVRISRRDGVTTVTKEE